MAMKQSETARSVADIVRWIERIEVVVPAGMGQFGCDDIRATIAARIFGERDLLATEFAQLMSRIHAVEAVNEVVHPVTSTDLRPVSEAGVVVPMSFPPREPGGKGSEW